METIHGYLKAHFAFVRQDLERVLSRLCDGDLPWVPAPGMPTIVGLLLEIANKERETLGWLQAGAWPDDDPDSFDVDSATLVDIRTVLDSQRSTTYAFIDSFSEAQLHELIPNPERWWEGMRLTECPRIDVLRNIAAHEWYHTAQLTTYLWAKGDDPSTWA